jgi:hypothetical protein
MSSVFLEHARKSPDIKPFDTVLFDGDGAIDVVVFEGPADQKGYSFAETVRLPSGLALSVLPMTNRQGAEGIKVNLGVLHFKLSDGRTFYTDDGNAEDAFVSPIALNDHNAFEAAIVVKGKHVTFRAGTNDPEDNWNPIQRIVDKWLMPRVR